MSAPTLAIAGADDPATPPAQLRAIAESVQDGRLLVVPRSAHPNDKQPELVSSAIIEHSGIAARKPGYDAVGEMTMCLASAM